MTFEEFNGTLSEKDPPRGMPVLLTALWYDAKGNWDRSHLVAQDVMDADGSWVHAYLHRKEGDLANARYWYSRSGRPEFKAQLNQEWEQIATDLLKKI